MKLSTVIKGILLLSLLLNVGAKAETLSASEEVGSRRSEKNVSIYSSLIGDISLGLFGLGVSYQIARHFQLVGGGSWTPTYLGNVYGIGAGVRYQFLPESKWTPVVGLNAELLHHSASRYFGGAKLESDTAYGGSVLAGLDFRADNGFHIGGGAIYHVYNDTLTKYPIPYLTIGCAF